MKLVVEVISALFPSHSSDVTRDGSPDLQTQFGWVLSGGCHGRRKVLKLELQIVEQSEVLKWTRQFLDTTLSFQAEFVVF